MPGLDRAVAPACKEDEQVLLFVPVGDTGSIDDCKN